MARQGGITEPDIYNRIPTQSIVTPVVFVAMGSRFLRKEEM